MPSNFTKNISPFAIAGLLDSISANRAESRKPSTYYAQGARVENVGRGYIAVTSGTTNTGTGPSQTSGLQIDGTVQWLYTGPVATTPTSMNANLYLGIGKKVEWATPSTPDTPVVTDSGSKKTLNDLITLLAVTSQNVRAGIPKNAWVTGTIYSPYNPDQSGAYAHAHYILADETRIYKCLDNNNGAPSTVLPSSTGTAIEELADGYIWKYVGAIDSNVDYQKFTTAAFIPCPRTSIGHVIGSISTFDHFVSTATPFADTDTIQTQIIGSTGTGAMATTRVNSSGGQKTITSMFASALGSGYSSETYAVAYDSAAVGSGATVEGTLTSGALTAATITAGGTAYVSASVLVLGDGTGAAASCTITGGVVTGVTIDTAGTGYTWIKLLIIPGTKGAAAKAVMAPYFGHGSNLSAELGANTLIISASLAASFGDYLENDSTSVDGSFRQLSLISQVDSTTSYNAPALIGPQHHLWSTPGSLNKYKEGSGVVLFINNVVAVTHTSLQEETFKVTISL